MLEFQHSDSGTKVQVFEVKKIESFSFSIYAWCLQIGVPAALRCWDCIFSPRVGSSCEVHPSVLAHDLGSWGLGAFGV